MIVEIEEVRDELCGSDPKQEAPVTRKLAATIALFERLTARVWNSVEDKAYYFQPEPTLRLIFLPVYPLESVTVQGWQTGQVEADAVDIDSDQYSVDLNKGVVARPDTATAALPSEFSLSDPVLNQFWPSFVKIVATGGYDSDTCPPEVKEAIIKQVKYDLARNDSTRIHMDTQSFGRSSTSYKKDPYHAEFADLAKRLRRKA